MGRAARINCSSSRNPARARRTTVSNLRHRAPSARPAAGSWSSTPCSARSTACRLTASRSPEKRSSAVLTMVPCASRRPQANQTVPTGLSGVPPSGPATPLTAMAMSPRIARAPRRHFADDRLADRPRLGQRLRIHAEQPCLERVVVDDGATEEPAGTAGRSVQALAIQPPVQDSAVTSRRPVASRDPAGGVAAHPQRAREVLPCADSSHLWTAAGRWPTVPVPVHSKGRFL